MLVLFHFSKYLPKEQYNNSSYFVYSFIWFWMPTTTKSFFKFKKETFQGYCCWNLLFRSTHKSEHIITAVKYSWHFALKKCKFYGIFEFSVYNNSKLRHTRIYRPQLQFLECAKIAYENLKVFSAIFALNILQHR